MIKMLKNKKGMELVQVAILIALAVALDLFLRRKLLHLSIRLFRDSTADEK